MALSPSSHPSCDISQLRLSESEWHDLRLLVHDAVGIKLSEAKRVFLASRLLKRLRATGARSFREYFTFVNRSGSASAEHQQLVNAVTTNKTDFFREASHFDVLTRWLAHPSAVIQNAKARGLRVWCAAASTGEEPYTIAAVLQARLLQHEWSQARIIASDIDTAVLETARRGIYSQASLGDVDSHWRARMFVQGSKQYRGKYRVRRDLRQHVRFVQQNLVARAWQVAGPFDAVFCRNVFIYFDRPTQEAVVNRLVDQLEPHGLLFMGASESLNGLKVSVYPIAHAAYAKQLSAASQHLKCAVASTAARLKEHGTPIPPRGCQRWSWLNQGEVEVPGSGWLCAPMHEALLFVLYDESSGQRLVGQVAFDGARSMRAVLQEAIVCWNSQHETPRVQTSLHAKIVISSRKGEFVAPSETDAQLAAEGLGVQVRAIRFYGENVHAWIEPGPMRILVRAESPIRQRASLGKAMCLEAANSGNR